MKPKTTVHKKSASLRSREDAFPVGKAVAGRFATIGNRTALLLGGAKDETAARQLVTPWGSVDTVDVDGVPHVIVWCSSKYRRALEGCSSVSAGYHLLSSKLSENGIKRWFYELWERHHNVGAARFRRAEAALPRPDRQMGAAIAGLQDTRTVRGAAKTYGLL